MNPEEIFAIYDNEEHEVVSVHPFRCFAEQCFIALNKKEADKIETIFTQGKLVKQRFIIGRLIDVIEWYADDKVKKTITARLVYGYSNHEITD